MGSETATLKGFGRLYANGRARATVGSGAFGASVRAELRMFEVKGSPSVTAQQTKLPVGSLQVERKPAAINPSVGLTMPLLGEIARRDIWAFTAPAETVVLPLL